MRLESKITVAVRKRPMGRREVEKKDVDIVEAGHPQVLLVKEIRTKLDLTKYVDEHKFIFDAVFGETATNEHIYDTLLKPLVMQSFQGAKVNCIAFGQTGSGKTYTMMGTLNNGVPGMYYLAAKDIFALVDSPSFADVSVTVGFFEIYCDKAYDLLNNREQCPIRIDGQDNVNIVGLVEAGVNGIDALMKTIQFGLSMRITGQTGMNDDSSRSHAILQINLKENSKLIGRMSFIDLAGSERGADVVDTDKQTRIDGAEINKSLLALKECIRALDLNKRHLPFRGSKLTLVLKDSFIGNCRTVMVGNISPGQAACEHTLNTLRYADRVKELKKTSASCERTAVSKDDQLAKALMLPRMAKDSQQTKIVEDKKNELNLVKPFDAIFEKKGVDSAKDKKNNIKDRFLGSRMADVRRSQGAAALSALIGLGGGGGLQERLSARGNISPMAEGVLTRGDEKAEAGYGVSEPVSSEVRAVKVTRITLDGHNSTSTFLSQTQSLKPSEGMLRNGIAKASSPEPTKSSSGLRTLGHNQLLGSDKNSFLKRTLHTPETTPTLETFADEKIVSTAVSGKSAVLSQKNGTLNGSAVTTKSAAKASIPTKAKSFLQPSEFVQSLKSDKNASKKPLEGAYRSVGLSESTVASKTSFAKAGGPKKCDDKRSNGEESGESMSDAALHDFQDAYARHITEMKAILDKDEAILNEMRRQKIMSSTGLALFMDAWKNLLNQKIRQVNSWKEHIKVVETSARSGKSAPKFVSIGNGLSRDDCIAEESLFEAEEV